MKILMTRHWRTVTRMVKPVISALLIHLSVYYLCYKLDAETKVTKRFRNPRARGCSVLSEPRALLQARGFLNRLVTVGRGV